MKRILLVLVSVLIIFIFYGPAYADLTDGLIAYYPFNGNANDKSGNGYHGIVNEAVLTMDRFGNTNSAYSFDGDDYIGLANTSTFNFERFSLAAWVNFSEDNLDVSIVGKHISGYPNGYSLGIGVTGWPKNVFNFFVDSDPRLLTTDTYNDLKWHFVVGVYDGVNQYLYVDGALKASQPKLFNNKNNIDVSIGRFSGPGDGFKGTIDDVRIYNRALSESEIHELYTDSPFPSLLGPSPYLGFDDSPFKGTSFHYFYLEDFEDLLLKTPGVAVDHGTVVNPTNSWAIDSVDEDDGVIDGSGSNGASIYHHTSMTFTFDAAILGTLPTHAGIVFTDGTPGGLFTFEAFDLNGISLGSVSANLGDGSFYGTTGEDRFFGVTYTGGISRILITDNGSFNYLEVDHLQYGSIVRSNPLSIYLGKDSYEFTLEQNTQETHSIRLFNPGDVDLTAILEILNPHSGLSVSLIDQYPVSIAPGETRDLSIVLDAGQTPEGEYDGLLLKLSVDDGSTLYSNIKVYIVQQGTGELPDLTLNSEDIRLTAYNPDDSVTFSALIHNRGSFPASNVKVQFYEFNHLLGETVIPEVPVNEMRSTSVTVPMLSSGDHLVRVVIDSSGMIQELDETNNEAGQIIKLGSAGATWGYIMVTGSLPAQVYAGSLFAIAGHAVYDLYINGIRNTDYVVKGGPVQITIKGGVGSEWIYGDVHTDVNGNFTRFLQAPASPGTYRIIMTVTDNTFIGKRELVFSVVERPSTPQTPPAPPATSGTGTWNYNPFNYTWNWIWTELPVNEPAPESDLRVFSENIHFTKNNPAPGEEITVFAEILYWASSTALVAQNVPVNFYVTYPGTPKMKIGQAFIGNISVGAPDFGSCYVYATWKNQGQCIYIVEAEIDPSYVEENLLNNAATRAIIVGQLQSNQGVISGQVTDPWGGVGNIRIDVFDSDGTTLLGSTLTDQTGYYIYENVPVGQIQVSIVTPTGYLPDAETKTATVSDQSVSIVDFHLRKEEASNLVIELTPADAINDMSQGDYEHTVTALLMDSQNNPQPNIMITFTINGVNEGVSGTCTPLDCTTDANGEVTFTYSNALLIIGSDTIIASFINQAGQMITSQAVTKNWIMTNIPPSANAGDDQATFVGDQITLDGTASFDPDNWPQPLSFTWRFVHVPGESTLNSLDIQDAGTANPCFTPDVVGIYLSELKVFDGEASDFDNVMVIVKEPVVLEPIMSLAARAKYSKIDLTWTPLPTAESYNIYRRVENEPYALIKEGHITDYAVYADFGLTNGVTYFYIVRWVDRNGSESPDSNEARATPKRR